MKQVKRTSKSEILLPFLCLFCMILIVFAVVFLFSDKLTAGTASGGGAVSSSRTGSPASKAHDPREATGFFLERTIFIGDSRTNGLGAYGYLPQERVYAVDGSSQKTIQEMAFIDMGDGRLRTVEEALKISRPRNVLLAFGVNEMGYATPEGFLEDYEGLLEIVRRSTPDSRIFIQAMLPVSFRMEAQKPMMSNKRIDEFNQLLKDFARREGCEFLDFSDVLKNENNCLDWKYDAGDGLHFNHTAYQKILMAITELTADT